jgi:hypothetical protein
LNKAVSRVGLLFAAFVVWEGSLQGQAAQYPRFLQNSYIGVQLGYIDYPFSGTQVQPGFQAQSIHIPHLAARVFLVGHEFNKYFSSQISDMRPVQWVEYRNVNGDQGRHSVWMNVAGLTGKARLPLTHKVSAYGEGGLGIVTRKGFTIGPSTVVTNSNYAALLFGGGLQYRINENWDLLTGVMAVPGRSADQQPRTMFVSGGFNYANRHLPDSEVRADAGSGPVWAKNIVEIGYVTDKFGYGTSDFLTKGAVPVFWTGTVEVASGWSANYQRNVLHTRRYVALDWGASVSSWKSRKTGDRFYTAAAYPALRFIAIRSNPVELYLSYSLAGPALITRTTIDGEKTGRRFTFQDFMGAGVFLGRKRKVTADVRIAHYSNGNLFPQNPGVTIPLGFYVGTSF